MSKYYITAHNKGKKITIPLEEKHIYYHQSGSAETNIVVKKSDTTTSPYYGYTVNSANIRLLFNTNNISISQGTGEDERIGNKIAIKAIDLTTYIYLLGSTIINNINPIEGVTTSFNFRIMCVKFQDIMSTTQIADWYQKTFIYYRLVSVGDASYIPFQSNWMDKLRESTAFTGSFKILYDKKFTLGKNHTSTQMNISLPIKYNVNFDNTSNNPTDNQEINNIYCFLIGPSNNFLDMDSVSCYRFENGDDATTGIAYMNTNIKVKYYDM